MLVLTRRKNESVVLGDEVIVTVAEIGGIDGQRIVGMRVRLGFQSPRYISIHRGELIANRSSATHGDNLTRAYETAEPKQPRPGKLVEISDARVRLRIDVPQKIPVHFNGTSTVGLVSEKISDNASRPTMTHHVTCQKNDRITICNNIACPPQVGRKAISADFWHPIREGIKASHGPTIHVFAQCAAAGDQCPAAIIRAKAEKVMTRRREISWKQELANRVLRSVEDVWPVARADVQTQLVFAHRTIQLDLPNKNSYNEARWMPSTVPIEIHVLRLGNIAIATNPFELFLDFGIQIKGRSKAVLTFISQLTCDHHGYLPTRRAVAGGDYSAVNHNVGPKGGRVLVDETVKAINSLWP